LADVTFPDLRSFLDRLRRDGDLAVVEAEVDARLEVAEIHRKFLEKPEGRWLYEERRRNARNDGS
jgi:4-hydroxybenzoate decarboxylase subunit C